MLPTKALPLLSRPSSASVACHFRLGHIIAYSSENPHLHNAPCVVPTWYLASHKNNLPPPNSPPLRRIPLPIAMHVGSKKKNKKNKNKNNKHNFVAVISMGLP